MTNVLWDSKRSISFLVKLLWGSIQLDILSFQLHIISNFQSLQIISLFVKLFLYSFFCHFYWFFASSQLLCSPLRKSSSFGNSIFTIRFSFHKCLPKLSLNRICPVITCFLLLYWNSTANNYSVQLSCW